jgi:hypothetical protein
MGAEEIRLCWRPADRGEIDVQVSNRVSSISAAGGLVRLLTIIPLYSLNGGNLTWPQQLIDGVTIEDACAALHGRTSWIFAVSKGQCADLLRGRFTDQCHTSAPMRLHILRQACE